MKPSRVDNALPYLRNRISASALIVLLLASSSLSNFRRGRGTGGTRQGRRAFLASLRRIMAGALIRSMSITM